MTGNWANIRNQQSWSEVPLLSLVNGSRLAIAVAVVAAAVAAALSAAAATAATLPFLSLVCLPSLSATIAVPAV